MPARASPHVHAIAVLFVVIALLATACGTASVRTPDNAEPTAELSACERERLAAALSLESPAQITLPLDPENEALADIAKDICALDTDGTVATRAPEGRDLSPADQRDAALPEDLVNAPARFNSDDPPPGDDAALDNLWIDCGEGVAAACNALLFEAPAGSDYEAFAFSCGGRENLHCNVLLGEPGNEAGLVAAEHGPDSAAPGTISELDQWWEACGGGSARACAELVLTAPAGSQYASYGWTCGGRTTRDCVLLLGDDGTPPALAGRSPDDAPPSDDEYLDLLWRRCGALDAPACRDLATFGPPGSSYERFALSCGWRAVRSCARLFAEQLDNTP